MNTSGPWHLDHYRLLGRSGLRVSPLCLGTMTFGPEWGWGADKETSRAIFNAYVERGGNFIDTANFYTRGTSERLVGEFVADARDRFVLATKFTLNMRPGDPNAGGNQRKCMVQAVEDSLRRLNTDYIDLYWMHAWDGTTPVDEVMRGLDDLVRAGKVLYVAVSDAPAWKIAQANTLAELRGWSRFIALQVEYNLALRDVERDLVPMAVELGLGVLPWSPLASGLLSGKYSRADLEKQRDDKAKENAGGAVARPITLSDKRLAIADAVKAVADEAGRSAAQVALNWLLTRPGVTSPILGARTVAQIEDNLGALDFALDPAHRERLDGVSAIELGFPHDFLASGMVRGVVGGGATFDGP
ncbi:MAG: aldo/keto reductase [Rhodospirillales bacterium]|nr:aldo/keto reductase [Rhodospirillales bacterium]